MYSKVFYLCEVNMKYLKAFTIFILTALLALSLTSCGFIFGDDEYYAAHFTGQERATEIAEKFIKYVNNKDAAGIKSMFDERNRTENENLDEEINQLLEVMPDGITEYEISPFVGSHTSTESWSVHYNLETANIFIPKIGLNSGDEDKIISIEYTHVNHYHENQVGVNLIRYIDRTDKENEKKLEAGYMWKSY